MFRRLFDSETRSPLLILVIWGLGLLHWAWLLGFPEPQFNVEDWHRTNSYILIWQQALQQGEMPYHINEYNHDTNRFLGLPETFVSPQILLLPWISLRTFVLLQVELCYTIGVAGCWVLARRYQFSSYGVLLLIFLTQFNGWITANLGVGHLMLATCMALPWLVWVVLRLLEEPPCLRDVVLLGSLLTAVFLQAAFHLWIWCVFFVALVGIPRRDLIRPLFAALVLSAALLTFRILPAIVTFRGMKLPFISGIPSLVDLLHAFSTIREPDYPLTGGLFGLCPWWEYDFYIGPAAFLAMAWFAFVWRDPAGDPAPLLRHRALFLPMAIMTYFSLEDNYRLIQQLPLPMLDAERFPSRLLYLPFVFVLVIGTLRLSRWLSRTTTEMQGAALIGLIITAFGLMLHSAAWRVPYVAKVRLNYESFAPVEIIQQSDPLYTGVFWASVLVSVVVAVILGAFLASPVLRARLAQALGVRS